MTPTLHDLELVGALTDEQRRAAGRLALAAARETFEVNGDQKDRGTKYARIAVFNFFADHYGASDAPPTFEDRLLAAGFLL